MLSQAKENNVIPFHEEMNDVLQKQQDKPLTPTITVPKKEIFLVLPYLGLQRKIVGKQIMSCIQ